MSLTKSSLAVRAIRVSAYVAAVALAILILVSVSARADEATDRFDLWAECKSMHLVVEGLPDDAATIGLTKDSIEAAVRSRLRAARLYTADFSPHYLYVRVTVLGLAFSTEMHFNKILADPLNDKLGSAITWSKVSLGTHKGEDPNYILGSLSQKADTFIDEYLRVNESACRG